MTRDKRAYRRIEKPMAIQFCMADALPKKWDVSVLKNISAGGIMFIASNNLKLKDKIIQLRIMIPELAPLILELEAMVVDVKARFNEEQSDIRAKFINLSPINKRHLSVLERMKV